MNVFDAGNALTRGFQVGSQIAGARAQPQADPSMISAGNALALGQKQYNFERGLVEDRQADADRAYEIGQRPMLEAQAGADLQKTKAEVEAVKIGTKKAAAEAAKIVSDTELKEAAALSSQLYNAARQAYLDGPEGWDRFEQVFGPQLVEINPKFDPAMISYSDGMMVLGAIGGAREGFEQEYFERSMGGLRQGQAAPGPDASERYKTVGGQLIDLQADGGPAPVMGVDGRSAGMSITLPDGTEISQGGPAGFDPSKTATPRNQSEMSKKLSASDVEYLTGERARARAAEDLAGLAERLEVLIPDIGYTGPGGRAYGAIDALLGDTLPGDTGARGAFGSMATEAQLTFTEKTKGAITEREMALFAAAVPNLTNTPEANQKIAQSLKMGAERTQTRAAFMEEYAARIGSLQGAEQSWDAYIKANPRLQRDESGLQILPEGNWRSYLPGGQQADPTATPNSGPSTVSTFEQFSADPSAQAAAQRMAVQSAIDRIGGTQAQPQRAPADRMADGQTFETASAASSGDVPEGMVWDAERQQFVDTALAAQRMGPRQGAAANYLAGTPFVGEWVDEGMGKFAGAMGGNAEVATETMRQSRDQFAEANPVTATALEVTGGIVGGAPLALKGVEKAGQAATRPGRVARGFGLGASAGAAEGAFQGAGRNDSDRTEGAVRGAALGGVLGGTIGGVAPLLGEVATGIVRRAKKLDVRSIADEFGLSKPAARRIKAALENDDLDAAVARLSQLGDDAMLADAGPATAQTLDDAVASGGRALSTTRGRVADRASRNAAWVEEALDDVLGPADGVKAASRDIAQRTSKAREAAYQRAWASPIDYSTNGTGRGVLEALDRVPDDFMADAIATANRRAKMQGQDGFPQIMASISDDGRVAFSELPNSRQLHELKVALADIAEKGTDPITGRLSPEARDARSVAAAVGDALKEASPAYARATKMGGDKIAEDRAFDLGRDLLSGRITQEQAREVMRGASVEAKQAAKRGLRNSVEDMLSQVRAVASDPNTDIRELRKLTQSMSSRAAKAKMRSVLSASEVQRLERVIDRAEASLSLRAAVARNSATAIRQAGRSATQAELQPGAGRAMLGELGNPGEAFGAAQLTRRLARVDPASMSKAEQELMAEIADALTGMRGGEAKAALQMVKNAMEGQPIKDQQAAFIGRVVSAGVADSGYQVGQQSLQLEP